MEYPWQFMDHIDIKAVFFRVLWEIVGSSVGIIIKSIETLAMADESGEESMSEYEERFTKLEIQVVDISHNMSILNYPTYDKELYALVQVVKKWKHYMVRKESVIHMDHQPLKYLQAQSKLQQTKTYKWIGFFKQFHLFTKYKKGNTN